jgi:hypothetical protein
VYVPEYPLYIVVDALIHKFVEQQLKQDGSLQDEPDVAVPVTVVDMVLAVTPVTTL